MKHWPDPADLQGTETVKHWPDPKLQDSKAGNKQETENWENKLAWENNDLTTCTANANQIKAADNAQQVRPCWLANQHWGCRSNADKQSDRWQHADTQNEHTDPWTVTESRQVISHLYEILLFSQTVFRIIYEEVSDFGCSLKSSQKKVIQFWSDMTEFFIFGLAIPLHSCLIMVMFLNLVYFFSSALKKRLKKPRPPYFSADPSSVVCEELSWPGSLFDVSFRRRRLYLHCISVKSITSSHHGHTC